MDFNLENFVEKYDVHPETLQFIKSRTEDGAKPYNELGVDGARKLSITVAETYAGSVTFDGTEQELLIPSANGGIPVTVYRPSSCDKMTSPTILVYFHGGGNTIGCRKTHDVVCKILARDSPCVVASVEYRLAPEHKFPANNDDAYTAVDWISENKIKVGGANDSKLGVSGDSAGGRLAAVVCHEKTKVIDFAILIYPNVSMRFEHASVQEFKAGPVLSWRIIEWFMLQFGITSENADDPRASVIRSKDFSKLPPTLIIVAELDPLRDGCYAYYEKLKAAGTAVEMKVIRGVPHAFWHIPVAFPETCAEAHKTAVQFIRKNTT